VINLLIGDILVLLDQSRIKVSVGPATYSVQLQRQKRHMQLRQVYCMIYQSNICWIVMSKVKVAQGAI
jgi:hypothetical protein